MSLRAILRLSATFALGLAADRAAKALAQKHLASRSIILAPGAAVLVLAHNTQEWCGADRRLVAAIVLGCIGTMGWAVRSSVTRPAAGTGLALVAAGAAGNAIDRLMDKSTVDFLGVRVSRYRLAVTNLADIQVLVGALLLAPALWEAARE